MARLFKKIVDGCHNCPACIYWHHDGEGESAPYSYYNSMCSLQDNKPTTSHIFEETKNGKSAVKVFVMKNGKKVKVPLVQIPEWCPLERVEGEE